MGAVYSVELVWASDDREAVTEKLKDCLQMLIKGEHARFSIDEGKIEHMRFILRDGSMITVEPDNESWTMVVKDGTAVDIDND